MKRKGCRLGSSMALRKHNQCEKQPGLPPTKAPAMPHLGAGVAQMAPGVLAVPGTIRKEVKGVRHGPMSPKL